MNETAKEINVVDNDPALLLVSGSKGDKSADKEYVKKLANAALQVFYKHKVVRMRCVGAASVNNATKASIITRGEAQKKGDRLVSEASFTTVPFNGVDKTGVIIEISGV